MSQPAKNNRWKWVFAVFLLLGLLVPISLGVVNLRLQMKPEQLEAARQRWDATGPADYVMEYTTQKNLETTKDHYVVKVKGKKPYEAHVNGSPLAEGLGYYGMDALFNDIERFQEMDRERGKPQPYVRAIFDEQTGAIRSYVRRVMSKSERLEITVAPLK